MQDGLPYFFYSVVNVTTVCFIKCNSHHILVDVSENGLIEVV